jgi:membrane dipeptidase
VLDLKGMTGLARRSFLAAGAGMLSLRFGPSFGAERAIYLSDMHRHLFFNRLATRESVPLGTSMASGGATLVAWALTTDVRWIGKSPRGMVQTGAAPPGESYAWFQRELERIRQHLAEQKLAAVRDADDVRAAIGGLPHVVLSTEGTYFLEGDISRIAKVHQFGIRHIQLAHFIDNGVADFQTQAPAHGGLTALGRQIVAECNRLGILIDLAHCTERVVDQVLEMSKAPVVWSHGSIAERGTPNPTMIGWKARQITVDCARRIARKGGVVGLWGIRVDVHSIEGYADRLLAMADQIGDDHVGIGTDTTSFAADAQYSLLANYSDVRKVVEHWQRKGVREARIRRLAIENHARILQDALRPRA